MDEFTVYSDCEYSRRKRFHIILDPNAEVRWKGKLWSDVLEWLYDHGATSVRVITLESQYLMSLHRQLPKGNP